LTCSHLELYFNALFGIEMTVLPYTGWWTFLRLSLPVKGHKTSFCRFFWED
jgi:hypothetical protein